MSPPRAQAPTARSTQLTLLPAEMMVLHALMGLLDDPIALLDERLQVLSANAAAQQVLGASAGKPLAGARLGDWLRLAALAQSEGRRAPPAPALGSAGGPRARASLMALAAESDEPARWLLHLKAGAASPATGSASATAAADAGDALMQILWSAPFPAYVQDAQARLQSVNAAFVELIGKPLEHLRGTEIQSLQVPDQDGRPRKSAARQASVPAEPFELRLLDSEGRPRQLTASPYALAKASAPGQTLVVLQDRTLELAARQQAERAQAELDQWLDLSPMPMVMFDDTGLLLRTNSAFAALTLDLPATLHAAPTALKQLLAWEHGQPLDSLRQSKGLLQTQASLLDPAGRTRWLAARLRPLPVEPGSLLPQRYMAVIEDRSLEQERDLAYQQLDALMDTAGVGLATFQQDAGWLRPRAGKGPPRGGGLAGMQGVGRDMVEPSSLADFERLQRALKKGDQIEVRYAVRHPELGRRWLLTRVEPGQLASGQRTTSVVTLDVTAQQQALARNEQLLHELTTIMDSSGVGMAYLRGDRLLRCNQGFELMLGINESAPAGTSVAQLFAALPDLSRQVIAALPTLGPQLGFDAEFVQVGTEAPQARWLSLSLRRVNASQSQAEAEAVAVISDISRLKAQQAELESLVQDRELMFSLSDVGIAILRHGKIERANDTLANLSGYRISELCGLEHQELFDNGAELERAGGAMQLAMTRTGLWRGERRVRRRDGSMLWVQVSERVMRKGEPDAGVIATYVNVDDRWRAQQSLMLQTERERAVLDSVLVGIVTVGRGGIEWMNRSARRMFGGDLIAFAGQPMSIVATPDPDHPFRRNQYLDELTEGQAETFECRLQARDGREFWVVGNAVVTGVEATGRQLTYALLDIERRRQAEAQTQAAQASLRRIIETAPLAITLHDAVTLRVEKINQVAAALAGRSEEELMGASPEELFGAEQGEMIRRDMLAALQSPEVTQREYQLKLGGRDDALRIWDARYLHLADVPDEYGNTAPEQLLLVASDVTEHRMAEEARLEAAISQRELLVREVHHRIKNNLQGVAGLLQQLAARRPEVSAVISEAVGQVQAIAQVYGLQVGSSGPLRVQRVVEAIIGSVQRMFGRQIRNAVAGPMAAQAHRWSLPEAESIPIALTLNELLTNAIKHSEGNEVVCTMICDEDRICLEIVNPGQLPHEFSLANVPGGVSGLGLVRALLPRRSATLSLLQRGADVVCSVELRQPSVSLLEPL